MKKIGGGWIASQSAGFEHQFEVRGNFAHYGPHTQLFQRSDPQHIRTCPRCGRCRRVWRPPHIKGPTDRPLVVKVREVPNDYDKSGLT